jgi:hypothetical protein
VTRQSIVEYAKAVKDRYLRAKKAEKTKILDEFTKTSGLHRKAVIRLLNRHGQSSGKRRRGRSRKYGPAVIEALKALWEASDRLCSKRLKPFLPELIAVMRRCGECSVTMEIEGQLCNMSAATIDRVLRPCRQKGGRHSLSTTSPGSLLRNAIPIRTFADWQENCPGFIEVDTVAHCGESLDGFYLNTLMAVDVATGWSEFVGVLGKGQQRIGTAVHQVREHLPFPLLGLDSDNGNEFINQHLAGWCYREGIAFTRSRPYKKNDSCYVEQKNGSIVRRMIGRERYSSRQAYEVLNRIYYLLRLYVNFLQPSVKLISKTRYGARVHKVYDSAQTPYRRLLKTGAITDTKKTELASVYAHLNPPRLLRQINDNVDALWRLRDHHPGEKLGQKTLR